MAYKDREKKRAYQHAWYLANREKKHLSDEMIKKRLAYAKTHPEVVKKATKIWVKKNPEKKRAHWALKYAIKTRKIVRSDVCLRCGTQGLTHAHHPDYSKPLEVEFLCSICHGKQHRMESSHV